MRHELELAVFLADETKELAGVRRDKKLLAKVTIAQQARDARQRLQMQAGGIFGRDQHEKQMRRVAVERLEINALHVTSEGPQNLGDLGQLAMRNRDAVADCGRAESLALSQDRR